MKKKLLCVILTVLFLLPFSAFGAPSPVKSAASGDYTIVSPYADVIWSGDNAWGAYKGNLHTHSFVSDARVDFRDMILEYYRQDFDFLAMTEHAVTGKAWNQKQVELPLYAYQRIIGNTVHTLTDAEFEGITSGAYPVNGKPRGRGMTCVTGGNELNGLTVTKCHVNGLFLPENVGNNHLGYENDHEGAVRLVEETGGDAVSFINHPGDWFHGAGDRALSFKPENVDYYANIILGYDSCLGMEVFNENNSPTRYDRVLWDNVLMKCLPYGKNVIAFGNSDAHYLNDVDSSFSTFMMEENDMAHIRDTMISGAFFIHTRVMGPDPVLGPKEDTGVKNQGLPYPMFTEVSVDGHKLTVKANEYSNIQWVANGKVIAEQDIEQSAQDSTYTLDLDQIEGAEDFLYVRCQLIGKGGITLTQAFPIDNGTEPLTYQRDNSLKAQLGRVLHFLASLRIFAIIETLIWKLS